MEKLKGWEKIKDTKERVIKKDLPSLDIEGIEHEFPGVFSALERIRDKDELYTHLLEQDQEGEKSHFRDALEMAEFVESLWQNKIGPVFGACLEGVSEEKLHDLEAWLAAGSKDRPGAGGGGAKQRVEKALQDNMISAALLHDIGKNGPPIKTESEREANARQVTRLMYRETKNNNGVNSDIRNAELGEIWEMKKPAIAEEVGVSEDELDKIIKEDLGYKDQDMNKRMIDFWRDHVNNTEDILDKSGESDFVRVVASSHHAHDGGDKNPAGLLRPQQYLNDYDKRRNISEKHENLTKDPLKYELLKKGNQFLTFIDIYQAATGKRGRKEHTEALEYEKWKIKKSKNLDSREKEEYMDIVNIFKEDSPELKRVREINS